MIPLLAQLPFQHFYFSSTGVTTLPFGNIIQTLKLFAKKPTLNADPFQMTPKHPEQKPYPQGVSKLSGAQLSAQEIEILSNRQAYRQNWASKWPAWPEAPNYKQMHSGSKATTNLIHKKNPYGIQMITIYICSYINIVQIHLTFTFSFKLIVAENSSSYRLSVEWNSGRLVGPVHRIVTKLYTKQYWVWGSSCAKCVGSRGVRGVGSRGVGGTRGYRGIRALGCRGVGVKVLTISVNFEFQ